ncbi:hypothetical protein BH23VER1_BH23VER1_14030 [soil metagenome]
MRPSIHVVPFEGQWAVRLAGSGSTESVHPTQRDALDAGVTLALPSDADVVVHRKNGTFRKVIHVSHANEGGGSESIDPRWYWAAGAAGAVLAGLAVYCLAARR